MFEQSFEEAMQVARNAGRLVIIRANPRGLRSGTIVCDQFTIEASEGLYGRVAKIIFGPHSSFAPEAGARVVRIQIDLSWERYCAVVELRETWPMRYYNLVQRFYELTERLLAEGLLPALCDEINAAIGEAAMLGRQIEEFDLRNWLRAEKRFFEGILSLECQDAVFRSFPILEDFVPSGSE